METDVKIWSILDILKASEKILKEKNIGNPRLNAELLLCDTLKTERIRLYLDFDKPLDEKEISQFREKIKRRLRNEPLQYITGKTEFYGLTFNVNPSVLIPRQETELIVDKAIEIIIPLIKGENLSPGDSNGEGGFNNHSPNFKILEIGTGSGCISVAVAANTDCSIDAVDISEDILDTAKANAELNNISHKVNFQLKNIFTDFKNFDGYDIIISNPPYIPADNMNLLAREIKDYEPGTALTDYKNGMEFYSKIIELAQKTENKIKVLAEIGDGRKEFLDEILINYKISDFTYYKDLMNIDRVVYFEIN